jgi:hypothetical protein
MLKIPSWEMKIVFLVLLQAPKDLLRYFYVAFGVLG